MYDPRCYLILIKNNVSLTRPRTQRNSRNPWYRQKLQLLLNTILRKFLCTLKIKFFLGVTWRSCGMLSVFNYLPQQPVQTPNY